VNATESVEVTDSSSPIGDQSNNRNLYVVDGQFPSGLISSSVAAGDAGNLTITTGQLVVRNGGQVVPARSRKCRQYYHQCQGTLQ